MEEKKRPRESGKRKAKNVGRRKKWDGAVKKQATGRALKPDIWSKTPFDIQVQLLRFLPLASLCRFRCVSTTWRSAVGATTPRRNEPCLISFYDDFHISIGGSWWKEFALAAIPEKCPHISSLSTSTGLVLATHGRFSGMHFSVHNPFVPGCGRVLGPLAAVRGFQEHIRNASVVFTGIQALRSTATSEGKISFAVVCVTSYRRGVLVHVFDSRRWSWVVECAPVAAGDIGYGKKEALCQGHGNHNNVLLQDDHLYFLTVSRSNIRSLKSVSVWDPEHTCKTLATWTDLPLKLHQNPYNKTDEKNHPSLISYQGKLMMVNAIPRLPRGAIGFVYLDEKTGSWKEYTSVCMSHFPENNLMHQGKIGCVCAASSPGSSSLVGLFFLRTSGGYLFDLAASNLVPMFSEDIIHPFQPSFMTF